MSLAASLWGGLFVVVRVAVTVIPPVPLVWLRYIIALAVLLLIGRCCHVCWKIRREDRKLLLFIGIIGNVISIVLQETGTMLSSAQMGSIITAATPAFMVLFARVLLGENLTGRKFLSVALASSGVLLIVADPDNMQLTGVWGGLALCIAAITWALMSVLLKRLPEDYSPIVVTTYGVATGAAILAPHSLLWLAQTDLTALLQPEITGAVLYMGIVSTAGGFIFWNRGLQLMEASASGLFFFFQPVVGTGLGWLLLGEVITIYFWLGSLLIVAGVTLVMIKDRPRQGQAEAVVTELPPQHT